MGGHSFIHEGTACPIVFLVSECAAFHVNVTDPASWPNANLISEEIKQALNLALL